MALSISSDQPSASQVGYFLISSLLRNWGAKSCIFGNAASPSFFRSCLSKAQSVASRNLARPAKKPPSEKTGGLKGSTQHWLAVYPPEFEIPTFFVAVDSDAERFRPGPTASSRTDPPSSAGTGAGAHWCFRSSRAAKGSADRRSRPVHQIGRAHV